MNPLTKPRRKPFEGVDLSAAGRKGGIRSGESRRLRPLTQLEAKVLQAKNGAAAVRLLQLKREDEAALLAERRKRDETVCSLIEMESELLHQVKELEAEREHAREQIAELRARIGTDEGLTELLLEAGEERVERACIAAGFVEDES